MENFLEKETQNKIETKTQKERFFQELCERYLFPYILSGKSDYGKEDEYDEGENLYEDMFLALENDIAFNETLSKEAVFKQLENYFGNLKELFVVSQNLKQKTRIFDFFHELKTSPFSHGHLKAYGEETLSFLLEKQKEPKENHYLYLTFLKQINSYVITSDIFDDTVIKKIAPDIYIGKKDSNIFVSSEKDKKEVQLLIEDFKKNTDKEDYSLSILGNSENGSFKSYEFKSERQKNFETLFSESLEKTLSLYKNISPDENIYDYYAVLLSKKVSSFIEEKSSISLNDLPISYQLFLIETLMHSSNEDADVLYRFLSLYKIGGAKSFLSIEHGGQKMGEKILSLGERFKDDTETAKKIFSKYTEIIDSADSILENVTEHFKKEIELSPESTEKIRDSLYRRGAELLVRFEAEKSLSSEEVMKELESIHTDTIATLSVFKYALRSGTSYSLEDITGAAFRKRTGEEFTDKEVQEMISMYKNNWKDFEPQEIIQEVIRKFEESLSGSDAGKNEVYTFTHQGNINAFVKFADLGNGVKYASALNVDSTLHGLSLGEAMMDEALAKEAQTSVLCAMCESDKPSAMRYFEKGFIATGFSPDVPPFLDIWWNENENATLVSKQLPSEELVSLYLKNQIPEGVIIKKGLALKELHSSFPEGMCLTRCFKNPAGQGWYAVYEQVPATYQESQLSKD